MPFAFVLLIVLFLVLPFLQQMIRAAQQAQEKEAAQPKGPRPEGAPTVRKRRPSPAAQPAPDLRTLESIGELVPPPFTEGAPRAARAVRPRRQPIDLRRAIVAMTVIGPCRAVRPYEDLR